MKMFLYIVVAIVVFALGFVRFAPSDPARWHVPPKGAESRTMKGGALRVSETGPDGLSRLDAVARATPRTRVLAGSVDDGMVTYITRSRVFGFPDYTTAQQDGDVLKLYARLRFGGSDFGVNAQRADAWLAAIQ